jgi:hypothetical protein
MMARVDAMDVINQGASHVATPNNQEASAEVYTSVHPAVIVINPELREILEQPLDDELVVPGPIAGWYTC